LTLLPKTADCVIVGGGVIGVSVAYRLAQAGMKPLLLERDVLGGGSTGRCAGGVRQQFSTEVNVRVGMLSRQLLERFKEETGHDPDFRQIGYLFLADDQAEAQAFARNVEMQHRVGLKEVRLIDSDEVGELVPQLRVDDIAAATFCPTDGLAGPNEVTMGYASAAQANGATVVEKCEVERVLIEHDRVVGVETRDGSVRTELVIDCAGPYAAQLAQTAHASVPVLPYRRHIFITETSPVGADVPMMVDFHTSLYMHPEGPGLLLGMSDRSEPSSFDTTVSWEFLEKLTEQASRRLPSIEQVGIMTGWAGLYEISPDNQAIVGESEVSGFWLCCGFSGHGFMQAPAMGLLLSQLITGKPTSFDITAFSPSRFTGAPLATESAVI
jgi:sarcosine oxidase subunit beta